ncbi:MAG: hypothetical protein ABSG84_08765 [Acidobacteriaceae bacterium]|jgi:hypothetical protein
MFKARLGIVLAVLLGVVATPGTTVRAQSFGGAFQRKKIVLVRKLPPTGHIDGSSFKVQVTGGPGDVNDALRSTIESLIISNDPRLHTVMSPTDKPDALITCQVTSYSPSQATETQAATTFGKTTIPAQSFIHVKDMMTVNFNAQDLRASRSIAANTVTGKFEQQYPIQSAAPPAKINSLSGMSSILSHIPQKQPTAGGDEAATNKPPTPIEQRDILVKSVSFQIVSHLVNTSEQVPVDLAVGGGLDDADKLMDQKLWTRALENLETMNPFGQPAQDAYRLYNLGVVNEALGYQAEDVIQARKYLQEASIDYGKAIDAKPDEKNFLQPQTRIDTALAYYKTLGDQAAASAQVASAAKAPAQDVLTNADVIAMVAAKLDQGNILDTIKTASAVNFDLSAHGQIDLAKGNVNSVIITAMKQKARGQ